MKKNERRLGLNKVGTTRTFNGELDKCGEGNFKCQQVRNQPTM
jgi:hypothetical protein